PNPEDRGRRSWRHECCSRHQAEVNSRLEDNIRRFKGRTEKMAKVARAMETRVERLKRELVEVEKSGSRVRLTFPQPEPSGRVPLSATGLAKAFGDNRVSVAIECALERAERRL